MFNIDNRLYVDVVIEGLDSLSSRNFISLSIDETAGLVAPRFELHLFQTDFRLYPSLVKNNLPIEISYGVDPESVNVITVRLSNYLYSPVGSGYNLTLTGLLDLGDFTHKASISAEKTTSDAILRGLTSITPEINYTGDDEQVWIQHNVPEKEYVERVLKNAYISEDDTIVSALTINGVLIARSLKEAFSKEPIKKIKVKPQNSSPDIIRYDAYQVESDSAIWSNLLSEGRRLPVFDLDRNMGLIEPPSGSINLQGEYEGLSDNTNYPPVLDSGNCHDNFHKAWLNNLHRSVQLMRNNVYIDIGRTFIPDRVLKLLDLVKFTPNNPNNSPIESIAGKYMITRKFTKIELTGFSMRLGLNRDYHV